MANLAALSLLRVSPIFRGLPDEMLAEVAALCRNREYRRNQTVFEEGAPGTKLYGVISGRLLITTSSAQGGELHLNVIGAGEIVGEIAFLDGGVRTASARAAELSTCFEIERAAFFELLEHAPQLSAHLLQLVCKRVRWMTKLAADSAFLSVPERLATCLRDLVRPGSADAHAEVRISQAELARFVGVSRQVVNTYLRAWQREGRVRLGRGTIQIEDLAAPF
jgi:CRP/FNR family transcriptional regulator, cyclic AMP receptor protein